MPHDGRFKTGGVCPTSGVYGFAGHLDPLDPRQPTAEEREVPLSKGERFPPLRSTGTACWWVLRTFA